MPTIKAFVTKHAAASYFALTFAISWGGVLAVAGPKIPATREEFERLLPSVVVMMLTGPSFAGILLTGIVYGKAGLRDFRSRLLKWRVRVRWYAAALLIAPALMTALLLGLSLFSPKFLPGIVVSADKTGFVLSGFAIALGAGIFEELGWTGFWYPRSTKAFSTISRSCARTRYCTWPIPRIFPRPASRTSSNSSAKGAGSW